MRKLMWTTEIREPHYMPTMGFRAVSFFPLSSSAPRFLRNFDAQWSEMKYKVEDTFYWEWKEHRHIIYILAYLNL